MRDGTDRASSRDQQVQLAIARRQTKLDSLPRCPQRIECNKGRTLGPIIGEPTLGDGKIANDQRPLLCAERARPCMANIDRRRAHIAEAELTRAQTEIYVLQITTIVLA